MTKKIIFSSITNVIISFFFLMGFANVFQVTIQQRKLIPRSVIKTQKKILKFYLWCAKIWAVQIGVIYECSSPVSLTISMKFQLTVFYFIIFFIIIWKIVILISVQWIIKCFFKLFWTQSFSNFQFLFLVGKKS